MQVFINIWEKSDPPVEQQGSSNSYKICTAFAVVLVALFTFWVAPIYAGSINVIVNNEDIIFEEQQPFNRDGVIFTSASEVFEALGFAVVWVGESRIRITNDILIILFDSGTRVFHIRQLEHTNWERKYLDVPALRAGYSMMIPLLNVLEILGIDFDWDGATHTVIISSPFASITSITPTRIDIQFDTPIERDNTVFVAFNNVSTVPLAEDFIIAGLPVGLEYSIDDITTDGAIITITGIPTTPALYNVNIVVTDIAGNQAFLVDVMLKIGGELISTTLTSLELYDRSLRDDDILSLRYMVNLTNLNLDNNQIRDLTPLSELTNLTRLSLSNNFIRDWSPVEHITNLSRGQQRLSSITLPNRRLTDAERQEWIEDYWLFGGPTDFEFEVVALINEIRQEHGLNTLTINDTLMLATRFYVQTKVNLGLSLSHTAGPYGGSGGTANAFGSSWNTANGAWGHGTPAAVVNGWMNSPGHRRNILNASSRSIGIGRYGSFTYMLTTW